MNQDSVKHGNRLDIQLVELETANRFVSRLHRHHKPVVGHRFSLGCYRVIDSVLVGMCICGRPVARKAGNPREIMEVTRVCTNGEKNACSFLLGASARISREMGFRVIQTYILESESGKSLQASGWVRDDRVSPGGKWKHTDGKERSNDHPLGCKHRYFKQLRRSWTPVLLHGEDYIDGDLSDLGLG